MSRRDLLIALAVAVLLLGGAGFLVFTHWDAVLNFVAPAPATADKSEPAPPPPPVPTPPATVVPRKKIAEPPPPSATAAATPTAPASGAATPSAAARGANLSAIAGAVYVVERKTGRFVYRNGPTGSRELKDIGSIDPGDYGPGTVRVKARDLLIDTAPFVVVEAASADGGLALYRLRKDGSDAARPVLLASAPSPLEGLALSADAATLCYATVGKVFCVPTDGSGTKAPVEAGSAPEGTHIAHLRWAADGQHLLVRTEQASTGFGRIFSMAAAGGTPVELGPPAKGPWAIAGSITNDDVLLHNITHGLYLVPLAGGEPVELSGPGKQGVPLEVLPGGKELLMVDARAGTGRSCAGNVAPLPDEFTPEGFAARKGLHCVLTGDIKIVPLDPTRPERVLVKDIRRLALSSDGSRLAFTLGGPSVKAPVKELVLGQKGAQPVTILSRPITDLNGYGPDDVLHTCAGNVGWRVPEPTASPRTPSNGACRRDMAREYAAVRVAIPDAVQPARLSEGQVERTWSLVAIGADGTPATLVNASPHEIREVHIVPKTHQIFFFSNGWQVVDTTSASTAPRPVTPEQGAFLGVEEGHLLLKSAREVRAYPLNAAGASGHTTLLSSDFAAVVPGLNRVIGTGPKGAIVSAVDAVPGDQPSPLIDPTSFVRYVGYSKALKRAVLLSSPDARAGRPATLWLADLADKTPVARSLTTSITMKPEPRLLADRFLVLRDGAEVQLVKLDTPDAAPWTASFKKSQAPVTQSLDDSWTVLATPKFVCVLPAKADAASAPDCTPLPLFKQLRPSPDGKFVADQSLLYSAVAGSKPAPVLRFPGKPGDTAAAADYLWVGPSLALASCIGPAQGAAHPHTLFSLVAESPLLQPVPGVPPTESLFLERLSPTKGAVILREAIDDRTSALRWSSLDGWQAGVPLTVQSVDQELGAPSRLIGFLDDPDPS